MINIAINDIFRFRYCSHGIIGILRVLRTYFLFIESEKNPTTVFKITINIFCMCLFFIK